MFYVISISIRYSYLRTRNTLIVMTINLMRLSEKLYIQIIMNIQQRPFFSGLPLIDFLTHQWIIKEK